MKLSSHQLCLFSEMRVTGRVSLLASFTSKHRCWDLSFSVFSELSANTRFSLSFLPKDQDPILPLWLNPSFVCVTTVLITKCLNQDGRVLRGITKLLQDLTEALLFSHGAREIVHLVRCLIHKNKDMSLGLLTVFSH